MTGWTTKARPRPSAIRKGDARRFTTNPAPTGRARAIKSLAISEGRSKFNYGPRAYVMRDPESERCVLKTGAHNSKIGGKVLVGRLKGAPIYTLTLEERATCPRSCALWASCYGNNMQLAHRMRHGEALEARLRRDLGELQTKHAKTGFLVRLHVLGDFYSIGYVRLWADALAAYPALHVFGFTARHVGTEIGDALSILRDEYPDRFMVRESGHPGRWGSVTIPEITREPKIGEAVVCPEQRDALNGSARQVHCGSCAVCWQTERCIVFMEH